MARASGSAGMSLRGKKSTTTTGVTKKAGVEHTQRVKRNVIQDDTVKNYLLDLLAQAGQGRPDYPAYRAQKAGLPEILGPTLAAVGAIVKGTSADRSMRRRAMPDFRATMDYLNQQRQIAEARNIQDYKIATDAAIFEDNRAQESFENKIEILGMLQERDFFEAIHQDNEVMGIYNSIWENIDKETADEFMKAHIAALRNKNLAPYIQIRNFLESLGETENARKYTLKYISTAEIATLGSLNEMYGSLMAEQRAAKTEPPNYIEQFEEFNARRERMALPLWKPFDFFAAYVEPDIKRKKTALPSFFSPEMIESITSDFQLLDEIEKGGTVVGISGGTKGKGGGVPKEEPPAPPKEPEINARDKEDAEGLYGRIKAGKDINWEQFKTENLYSNIDDIKKWIEYKTKKDAFDARNKKGL